MTDIKSLLDTKRVIEYYGFKTNRAGFIPCPFHQEKTASLKVYDGNRGWSCFGCGEHGSIIDFVMKLFGLQFKDAVVKLREDFGIDSPRRTRFQNMKYSIQWQQVQQTKAEKCQARENYWRILAEWKRLDDNKRIYAPKYPGEEPHALFVEALKKLSYQEYLLDIAELRLYEFR